MKNTLLSNDSEIQYLENLKNLSQDEFFVICKNLIKEGKNSKAFYLELSEQILVRPLNESYQICLVFNLAILLDMFKTKIKESTLYNKILQVTDLEVNEEINYDRFV